MFWTELIWMKSTYQWSIDVQAVLIEKKIKEIAHQAIEDYDMFKSTHIYQSLLRRKRLCELYVWDCTNQERSDLKKLMCVEEQRITRSLIFIFWYDYTWTNQI